MKTEKRKWCLVGGSNGLIGKEIVRGFKKEDYHVVEADIEGPHQYDLREEKDVKKLYDDHFQERFEEYVLVNCQAIADPMSGFIGDLSVEKWKAYMDSNVLSYFLLCREFARRMPEGKSGSVINLASTRHLMAEPDTEAYCATKGAIVSFTKAFSISLGKKNIRANSVSPGWIAAKEADLSEEDHKQHPTGRVGNPEDIASLCLFLADPRSSFITGQDFVSDGGMTSKMIYV